MAAANSTAIRSKPRRVRIALAIDGTDWHARVLLRALTARRAEAQAVRLGHCVFDTTAPHGIRLPGFADSLPDAVLVRAISGGSFEEVTRRLGILHALRELGVPVWNDARAIERCVDKSTTSFFLAQAGLPTPPTWAVEGLEAARTIAERETPAGKLVLKPLFGSQGRGLRLIERADDLPPPTDVAGIYYLQRYVPPSGTGFADQRLFVCDGEVLAAMTRRSSHWITNIGRGAAPEALTPSPDVADLALRAAASVGAHFAGVDLLRDRAGQTFVLEVNSMPAWRGLQKVTPVSIADHVAAALLRRLG
jgi:tetrahydromethanopterin:alpha-L-glutamate ligase